MDSRYNDIINDIEELIKQGNKLTDSMRIIYNDKIDDKMGKIEKLNVNFYFEYEIWYSEALALVKQVLPYRVDDFKRFYKNENRKSLTYETYTISDSLIGLTSGHSGSSKVTGKDAIPKMIQQISILKSASKKFNSHIFDLNNTVYSNIFDSEIDEARVLCKNNFYRAAGVIAGVVLEGHLKQVCINNEIKFKKRNASISIFNDLLKENGILDVPAWRYIQHLGDLRNLCGHKKDVEPTKNNIEDLINGVDKITKTVY